MWVTLSLLLTFSITCTGVLAAPPDREKDCRQVDVGRDGMVVSAHPEASKVGAQVLRKGGNAVDAAVAIQFALNVVKPMMSGIGGGGFMMVYDQKSKKITIVDSRERAPMSATPDMFLGEDGKPIPFQDRHTRGNAVGVPGTLKGLDTALKRWGTMPLSDLILLWYNMN
ncbi:hypothetical protein GCM10007416_26410 [Kroppenstedtia guangzhouensis]|uniref:Gamma-glutamyltranspeptidase / glutathione hydrolase n=1 Tax=Kroppenstedtia guangzhouensis TaxID=1274356 RepID=A0ABQ1GY48_9BACL|nr:hypothetical protein GCM10007416_26410 [Kroppenstedtia guangzhouensis]